MCVVQQQMVVVKGRFRQGEKNAYSSSVPITSYQCCLGAGAKGGEVETHSGQVSHLPSPIRQTSMFLQGDERTTCKPDIKKQEAPEPSCCGATVPTAAPLRFCAHTMTDNERQGCPCLFDRNVKIKVLLLNLIFFS